MADLHHDMALTPPPPAVPDTPAVYACACSASACPAWTGADDEFRTAAELAALRLTGLPTTKRRINIMARLEGWQQPGSGKARKRRGSGGGWEYHISCLSDAAQSDYRRRLETQSVETQTNGCVAGHHATGASAAAISTSTLSARQRRVMEARSVILREVDRRVFAGNVSRRRAILALVEDVAWDLYCVEQGRNDRCVLAPELLQAACDANDRRKVDRRKGDGGKRNRTNVLSLRGVYGWFEAHEAGGAVALAPAATRRRQDHPQWLNAFLRFYCTPARISIGHALEKYAASLPPDAVVPSYDQAKRALKALQGTARFLDAHRGREGRLALKARLGFITRTLDGLDPTTIYTADGKTFDALVEHPVHHRPFRPEITTVLDVVTRRIVGWSVGLSENTVVVAEALRRACESHGIPAIFYSDRGPGYRNRQIDHATLGLCARLGITTTHSLPYNAQARGLIERVGGTVWNRLAKDMPTYMGEDMDREARRLVDRTIDREIRQHGASPTLPTFAEFKDAAEAAIAAYNDRVHASLRVFNPLTRRYRKAAPNEVWADFAGRGFEPVPLEAHEADDLFRPVARRKVHRGAVSFNTNRYFDERLEPYHGMEVLVGHDIFDASRVWVRRLEHEDGAPVAGALICVAAFFNNKHAYVPKTMQDSAVERRAKGRLKRIEAHRQEAIEEASPVLSIEHRPSLPVSFPAQLDRATEALALRDLDGRHQRVPVANAMPADQYELAGHCIAHPGDMTANRRRLLVQLVNSPAARELFELNGGRLEDLKTLLTATASPSCERKLARQAIDDAQEAERLARAALTVGAVRFEALPDCPTGRIKAQEWFDTHSGLVRKIGQTEDALAHHVEDIAARRAQAEQLTASGGLVADDEAQALQDERYRLWQAHRSAMSDETADPFETAMQALDAAMRSRVTHASDLGQLRQVEQACAETQARADETETRLKALRAEQATLQDEVNEAAASVGLPVPQSPQEWLDWVCRHGEAADAAQRLATLRNDHQSVLDRAQRLVEELRPHVNLQSPDFESALTAARRLAEAEAERDATVAVDTAREALGTAENDLARRREKQVSARQQAEEAETAWRSLVCEILGYKVAPETLLASLDPLRQLREHEERRADVAQRVATMEADRAQFLAQTAALATAHDLPVADTAAATFDMLRKQSEAAGQAEARAADLTGKIEQAGKALEQTQGQLDGIRREVEALGRAFEPPVETLDALRSAATQAQQVIDDRDERAKKERAILSELSAPDMVQVRDMLDGITMAGLEAEANAVEADLEAADQRLTAATAARAAAGQDLSRVTADADIAVLTERKATLELELEEAALEHLELSLGHGLAQEAIRRYRDTHRGGMMAATERAFAALTRDAYPHLATRPDGTDETLLAYDSHGAAKRVAEMSKGTRFQLYLALRAAAHAQMVEQGVCLPFFCDDIFETFDEDRTLPIRLPHTPARYSVE